MLTDAQIAAIVREPVAWRFCLLCQVQWPHGEPEYHATDCPAAPVGAAPMEDAR